MKNIYYTINNPSKGVLSPDEVHFFYYDVMRDTEDDIQAIYEWNEDIERFLNKKELKVEEINKGTLSNNVGNNVICFTVSENESKPLAFFRHLRNAFAHHRIVQCGEFLRIEDIQGKDFTMVALVKFQDLKALCFLFFEQKTKFETDCNL